ncbi:MAG: hypothetical protein OHK0040_01160 [bacterium]
MKEEDRTYLNGKELSEFLEKKRSFFYSNLPFFIENHTPYKVIPYIYSKELTELIDSNLKTLKELIVNFVMPYEEKSKRYDYALFSTPLIGMDKHFLEKLLFYDNLVDKRCIERWLVPNGRLFTRKLKDILIKIAKDFGKDSSVPQLFLTTLLIVFKEKKGEFVSLNLGKVTPERKDVYFSNLFYFFLRLITDVFTTEIKDPLASEKLNVQYLSPLILYNNKEAFLRNPFNYWHMTKQLFEMLETNSFYEKSDIQNSMTREIYNEAVFAAKVKLLREHIFEFITSNYVEDEFMSKLVTVYYTPSFFFNFFKENGYREELLRLKKNTKIYKQKEGKDVLEAFERKTEHIINLSDREKLNEEVKNILANYFVYKNHEAFSEQIKMIMREMKDRRNDVTVDLKNEYDNGRLYYFASDNSPVLKISEKQDSAAVYIDIREFSKKTFHLKEEAVIELLKEKFYLPLLRYAGVRKDVGNIQLANIVGDAMVFLGPIDEIVKLSLLVKRHLNDYKRGLEHLIEDEEKKELMALDIGVFISFGKSPLITTVSSEFGNHTFAIGEIINEASRGSKRDANAFNRISYMVNVESRKRGVNLKIPFDVVIVEGYELIMPPTVEFNLLRLEKENEIHETMKQFFEQAKTEMFLKEEASERIWEKRKYIYNIGIGLTEDALRAFINSQSVFSDVKSINISTDNFSKNIQRQFFFRHRNVNLLFIKNKSTGEKFIFRKEGGITFRGFYTETKVWELLTEHQEIYPEILSIVGKV